MIKVVETAEADADSGWLPEQGMASHYRRSTLAGHVIRDSGVTFKVQTISIPRSASFVADVLCRFAEEALVTRMSCQTVLNTSGVQVYRTVPMVLWSSNGRRSRSPVKWTNSHLQRQLVGCSIDSDHERAMRNRLDDANTSEACIIHFRSESNLNTRTGILWKVVLPRDASDVVGQVT